MKLVGLLCLVVCLSHIVLGDDAVALVCVRNMREYETLMRSALSFDKPKRGSVSGSGDCETVVRVYGVDEEHLTKNLKDMGMRYTQLPATEREPIRWSNTRFTRGSVPTLDFNYHDNNAMASYLQSVANAYPEIARLHTVGTSVRGTPLLVLQISRNPDVNEQEPKTKLVANVHGDETVGREVLLHLIELFTSNYSVDPVVTELIDNSDMYFMPSMNPDGFASRSRYNANRNDLNRNFPDMWYTQVDSTSGRQPETKAIMDLTKSKRFVLSASYHGGDLVANYGYDNNPSNANVYSAAPDDAFFKKAALTYSRAHTTMHSRSSFPQGITNGAAWYPISGGMQDYCYHWHDNMDITLELADNKWPAASQLPELWVQNRGATIAFLQLPLRVGVRGVVTDATTGLPIEAKIVVASISKTIANDRETGFYQRLLAAGTYSITATATGFQTSDAVEVVLSDNQQTPYELNFALTPLQTSN